MAGRVNLAPTSRHAGVPAEGKTSRKEKFSRLRSQRFHRVHGEERTRPRSGADGVVEVMVEVELDVAEGGVGILEAAQEERAFEGADD